MGDLEHSSSALDSSTAIQPCIVTPSSQTAAELLRAVSDARARARWHPQPWPFMVFGLLLGVVCALTIMQQLLAAVACLLILVLSAIPLGRLMERPDRRRDPLAAPSGIGRAQLIAFVPLAIPSVALLIPTSVGTGARLAVALIVGVAVALGTALVLRRVASRA